MNTSTPTMIRKRRRFGYSTAAIAKETGLSAERVRAILRGDDWELVRRAKNERQRLLYLERTIKEPIDNDSD